MVKRIVKTALASFGYSVVRARPHSIQDGLYTAHSAPFLDDTAFNEAYGRGVKASNGVDAGIRWRVHAALWAAAMSIRVAGDFVECGVNAGFVSSAIMRYLNWSAVDRRFYLIDTFDGPSLDQFSPEEERSGRRRLAEDALAAGSYVTDLDRVRANFAEWPNAEVVQGLVPDVLRTLAIDKIAFLHLDMNCAYPERAALEFFWNRLSKGAMALLDDYGYFGHDEQARAIDAAARSLGAEVLSLPTGQGLIMR